MSDHIKLVPKTKSDEEEAQIESLIDACSKHALACRIYYRSLREQGFTDKQAFAMLRIFDFAKFDD